MTYYIILNETIQFVTRYVLSYTILSCLLNKSEIYVSIQSFLLVIGAVLPDVVEYINIIWLYSILVKLNKQLSLSKV